MVHKKVVFSTEARTSEWQLSREQMMADRHEAGLAGRDACPREVCQLSVGVMVAADTLKVQCPSLDFDTQDEAITQEQACVASHFIVKRAVDGAAYYAREEEY